MLPLHHPFFGISTSGREVDLSQPSLINLVDYLHQCLAARSLLLVGEQVTLLHADGDEVGKHDAAFHIPDVIPPDAAQQGLDLGEQLASVGGGHRQPGGDLVAVVGLLLREGAAANKQGYMAAQLSLGPQLFGSSLHITGQRLPHGPDLCDALTERARTDDLLLGLSDWLELGAGDPPQFLNGTLDDNPIPAAQAFGVGCGQISYGIDALGRQLGGELAADPPDLIDRGDRHQLGCNRSPGGC